MVTIGAAEIDARAAHKKKTEQNADHQCDQQSAAFRQCREYHVIGWVGQRRCRIAAKQIGIEQCFARLQDLVACALCITGRIQPVDEAVGDFLYLREDKFHRTKIAGTARDLQQRHTAGGKRCTGRCHDGEDRYEHLDIRHKQENKAKECAQDQQECTELTLHTEEAQVDQRDKDGSPDALAPRIVLGAQQPRHHKDIYALVKFRRLQRHAADADPVADTAADCCAEHQRCQIQHDRYPEQERNALGRGDDRHMTVQEAGDQSDSCRQRIVHDQRRRDSVLLQQHTLYHCAKGKQHRRADKKRRFRTDAADDQPTAVSNNQKRDHHIQICRPALAYHLDKQRNQLE